MDFFVKRTSQPSFEPVSVLELKAHLKITGTAEDTYLETLITASRETLETFTSRSWCESTYVLSMPQWFLVTDLPYAGDNTSVTSVSYQDDSYPSPITYTTISSSHYVVCTDVAPAVIRMKSTWSIPAVTLAESNAAVKVTYTTGFADSNSVPAKFKQALMLYAAYLYENREAQGREEDIPKVVKSLLNSDRVHSALSYVGSK